MKQLPQMEHTTSLSSGIDMVTWTPTFGDIGVISFMSLRNHVPMQAVPNRKYSEYVEAVSGVNVPYNGVGTGFGANGIVDKGIPPQGESYEREKKQKVRDKINQRNALRRKKKRKIKEFFRNLKDAPSAIIRELENSFTKFDDTGKGNITISEVEKKLFEPYADIEDNPDFFNGLSTQPELAHYYMQKLKEKRRVEAIQLFAYSLETAVEIMDMFDEENAPY